MMQEKNNEQLENQEREWVFIPLLKKHVIKRTDTYLLFDLDGIATGIVSAKFIRKKETDDFVFLSLPPEYEVNCRTRTLENGKWVTACEIPVKALYIREKVLMHNKE